MNSNQSLRIIYITDVHEATKELRYIFKKTAPDLYLLAGDLLYRPFYSYDTIAEFITLQEELLDFIFKKALHITPHDLALNIKNENSWPLLKDQAGRYLQLYSMALKNMKDKYAILESIFQTYSQAPVYIIPGNYDLNPEETALEKRNLHRKSILFSGYKISGYGSADVRTPGIPEKLVVSYNEKNNPDSAYEFFKKENPNIMLIHKPVYGYFDRLSSHGSIGSIPLAQYIEEKNDLCLVLSGHVHEDRGMRKSHNIIFLNPGNLGKTIQPKGFSQGGFFSEIILDKSPTENGIKGSVRRIQRFHFHRGRIQLIEERNFPLVWANGKFGLYQELKFFFRKFETIDAKLKVKDLINIARQIRKKGEKVAFDLLGSVSFGMSEKKSDVDLVMYHLCPEEWVCDLQQCAKSKKYQEMLLSEVLHEISKSHYNFEVIDCININLVLQAIKTGDKQNDTLIRYFFYRKVGRSVNRRFLKNIDHLIAANPSLTSEINKIISDLMQTFSRTTSQKESLKKYQTRLREMGITLPQHIEMKIFHYLGFI